jgi:hypothetical protein
MFRDDQARLRTIVVAAVAVGSVLAIAVGSAFWMDDPDWWGAFGQWMGAGGTVLAVVVALRIARGESSMEANRLKTEADMEAIRLQAESDREAARLQAEADRENTRLKAEADRENTRLQIEDDRLQAEIQEKEIEQARLVMVRMDYPPDNVDSRAYPRYYVLITNHSSKPILEPRLEGFAYPNDEGVTHWDIEDPQDFYQSPASELPASGKELIPVTMSYDPPLTAEQSFRWRKVPIIVFTDEGGLRWRRRGSGQPEQLSKDDVVIIDGPSWYR